ncbi:MAG: hypothetical protein AABY32_01395 [Nanoarchaeota archaeon]
MKITVFTHDFHSKSLEGNYLRYKNINPEQAEAYMRCLEEYKKKNSKIFSKE